MGMGRNGDGVNEFRNMFDETQWTAALTTLEGSATRVENLMTDLVAQCLTDINELYSTGRHELRSSLRQ